jgi:hypothetical protein
MQGYHFGVLKLDVKTKTATGVEFSSGGSSVIDTGKVDTISVELWCGTGMQLLTAGMVSGTGYRLLNHEDYPNTFLFLSNTFTVTTETCIQL